MLAALIGALATAGAAERMPLEQGWQFRLGDQQDGWRTVVVPHDWSVESAPHPDATSGPMGGYHQTGVGWYQRKIDLGESGLAPGERCVLEFGGVYQDATVWLDGERLGDHFYGYTPFSFDISRQLRGKRRAKLVIRVANSQPRNSRWHSGSGLYRPVWLVRHGPVWTPRDSVWLVTNQLDRNEATVEARFCVARASGHDEVVQATVDLIDEQGDVVASGARRVLASATDERRVAMRVPRPMAWSPDDPAVYELRVTLHAEGDARRVVHRQSVVTGIRTIAVDAQRGLLLNGKPIKLFGGNVHHDNGPLGAVAWKDAEWRKAALVKRAGFNAVRTAHNPSSEAFLDACDRLGLLVLNEAFDGWIEPKVDGDYGPRFESFWREDLRVFVRRDRRHPSVFAWSVGNEMTERTEASAVTLARELVNEVKKLDESRPVTAGVNASYDETDRWEDLDPLFGEFDLAGYNYRFEGLAADRARTPKRVVLSTESYPRDASVAYGAVSAHPWVIGDFVWSAIDYLGEAGIGRVFAPGEPIVGHWEGEQHPWRAAYCGDIDLIGTRKPRSHHRAIVWGHGERLHLSVRPAPPGGGEWGVSRWALLPDESRWTWDAPSGAPFNAVVASRWPRVRLEQDGQFIGAAEVSSASQHRAEFPVRYGPGSLTAIGLDASGVERERTTLKTAGPPAALRLMVERTTCPGEQRLAFVQVSIVDSDGAVQPLADRTVRFRIDGEASLAAVGNANPASTGSYRADAFPTFGGRALAVVRRAEGGPRVVKLIAEADGLLPAEAEIAFADASLPAAASESPAVASESVRFAAPTTR